MSNKLRKKSKDNIFKFTSTERKGIANYDNFKNSSERFVMMANRRIELIISECLCSKLEFGSKKLDNFWANFTFTKSEWRAKKVPMSNLMSVCAKKGIDVSAKVKAMSNKDKVFMVCRGTNINPVPGMDREIDASLIATLTIMTFVLKEIFKISTANLNYLYWWIDFYINSYARGYVTDEMLISEFKEEYGYHLMTRENVDGWKKPKDIATIPTERVREIFDIAI